MPFSLFLLIPVLGAAIAAWWDLRYFRIPNLLCLSLVLLFFPAAWLAGLDLAQFWLHAKTGGGAFIFAFFLFALRFWGGGDAKLYPALCLWLGWPQSVSFTLAMVLTGGVISLILIALRGVKWPERLKRHPLLRRLLAARRAVPYGLAMAVGMLWTHFHG